MSDDCTTEDESDQLASKGQDVLKSTTSEFLSKDGPDAERVDVSDFGSSHSGTDSHVSGGYCHAGTDARYVELEEDNGRSETKSCESVSSRENHDKASLNTDFLQSVGLFPKPLQQQPGKVGLKHLLLAESGGSAEGVPSDFEKIHLYSPLRYRDEENLVDFMVLESPGGSADSCKKRNKKSHISNRKGIQQLPHGEEKINKSKKLSPDTTTTIRTVRNRKASRSKRPADQQVKGQLCKTSHSNTHYSRSPVPRDMEKRCSGRIDVQDVLNRNYSSYKACRCSHRPCLREAEKAHKKLKEHRPKRPHSGNLKKSESGAEPNGFNTCDCKAQNIYCQSKHFAAVREFDMKKNDIPSTINHREVFNGQDSCQENGLRTRALNTKVCHKHANILCTKQENCTEQNILDINQPKLNNKTIDFTDIHAEQNGSQTSSSCVAHFGTEHGLSHGFTRDKWYAMNSSCSERSNETDKTSMLKYHRESNIGKIIKSEDSTIGGQPDVTNIKQEYVQEYELDHWCDLGPSNLQFSSGNESTDNKDVDIESFENSSENSSQPWLVERNKESTSLSSSSEKFPHAKQTNSFNHGLFSAFHRPTPICTNPVKAQHSFHPVGLLSYPMSSLSNESSPCAIRPKEQSSSPVGNVASFSKISHSPLHVNQHQLSYPTLMSKCNDNFQTLVRNSYVHGTSSSHPDMFSIISPPKCTGAMYPHHSSVNFHTPLYSQYKNVYVPPLMTAALSYNHFQTLPQPYQQHFTPTSDRRTVFGSGAEDVSVPYSNNVTFAESTATSMPKSFHAKPSQACGAIQSEVVTTQQPETGASIKTGLSSNLRKRRSNSNALMGGSTKQKSSKHDDDFIDPTRMRFGHDDDGGSEEDALMWTQSGLGDSSDEEWRPEKNGQETKDGDDEDSDSELEEGHSMRDLQNQGRCTINVKKPRSTRQTRQNLRQANISARSGSKEMKCPTCGKVCYGKYQLSRHQMSHSEHRPHRCAQCGKGFKQKAHLKGHMKSVHSKSGEAAKTRKKRKFSNATYVSNRAATLKPKMTDTDKNNPTDFKYKENIGPNCESRAPEGISELPVDNEVTSIQQSRQTTKTGRPKNPRKTRDFSCHICGKAFKTAYRLKRHEQSHTDLRPYPCRKCGKRFKQSGHRNEHEANHERQGARFLCNKCGVVFRCRSSFNSHMRAHGQERRRLNETEEHGEDQAELSSQAVCNVVGTAYDCPYCVEKFSTAQALNNHLDTHVEIAHRRHVQPYSCDECRRTFTYRHNLMKHILMHKEPEKFADFYKEKIEAHVASGKPSYKCPHCSKIFIRKETLAKHAKIHTGAKPFKCSICSQSFTQNIHLKVHMRKHTGSRPFQCRECGKGFIDSTALAKHIEYEACHSGNYTYHCKICDKRHYYIGSIKQHMRKEHGILEDEALNTFIERTDRAANRAKKSGATLHNVKGASENTRGDRPCHQCKLCERTFKEKQILLRHVRCTHGQVVRLLRGDCDTTQLTRFDKSKKIKDSNDRNSWSKNSVLEKYSALVSGEAAFKPITATVRDSGEIKETLNIDTTQRVLEGTSENVNKMSEKCTPVQTDVDVSLHMSRDFSCANDEVFGNNDTVSSCGLSAKTSISDVEGGHLSPCSRTRNDTTEISKTEERIFDGTETAESDNSSPSENFLYKIGLTVSTKVKRSTSSAISVKSRPISEHHDNVFAELNCPAEELTEDSRSYFDFGVKERPSVKLNQSLSTSFTDTISVLELHAKHVSSNNVYTGESFVVDLNKLEGPASKPSSNEVSEYPLRSEYRSETNKETKESPLKDVNVQRDQKLSTCMATSNSLVDEKDILESQLLEKKLYCSALQKDSPVSEYADMSSPVPLDLSQAHLRPVTPDTTSKAKLAGDGTAPMYCSYKENTLKNETHQSERSDPDSLKSNRSEENKIDTSRNHRSTSECPNSVRVKQLISGSCAVPKDYSKLSTSQKLNLQSVMTSSLLPEATPTSSKDCNKVVAMPGYDNTKPTLNVYDSAFTDQARKSNAQSYSNLQIYSTSRPMLSPAMPREPINMTPTDLSLSLNNVGETKDGLFNSFKPPYLSTNKLDNSPYSNLKSTSLNVLDFSTPRFDMNNYYSVKEKDIQTPHSESVKSKNHVSITESFYKKDVSKLCYPYQNHNIACTDLYHVTPRSAFTGSSKPAFDAFSVSDVTPHPHAVMSACYNNSAQHIKHVAGSNTVSTISHKSSLYAAPLTKDLPSLNPITGRTDLSSFVPASHTNAMNGLCSHFSLVSMVAPQSIQRPVPSVEEKPTNGQLQAFASLLGGYATEEGESKQKPLLDVYVNLKQWLMEIGGLGVDQRPNTAKAAKAPIKNSVNVKGNAVPNLTQPDCLVQHKASVFKVVDKKFVPQQVPFIKQTLGISVGRKSYPTVGSACQQNFPVGPGSFENKVFGQNITGDDDDLYESRCIQVNDWFSDSSYRTTSSSSTIGTAYTPAANTQGSKLLSLNPREREKIPKAATGPSAEAVAAPEVALVNIRTAVPCISGQTSQAADEQRSTFVSACPRADGLQDVRMRAAAAFGSPMYCLAPVMSENRFPAVLGLTGTSLATRHNGTVSNSNHPHPGHIVKTVHLGSHLSDTDTTRSSYNSSAGHGTPDARGYNPQASSHMQGEAAGLGVMQGPSGSLGPFPPVSTRLAVAAAPPDVAAAAVGAAPGPQPLTPDSTVKTGNGFACGQCGKIFNARHRLKRHELTHTNFRPYICGQCGRAFRQKVHLSDHIKRHAGDRPFACDGCGKKFILKNEMNQHIKHYCCGAKRDSNSQARDAVAHISPESLPTTLHTYSEAIISINNQDAALTSALPQNMPDRTSPHAAGDNVSQIKETDTEGLNKD